MYDESAVKYEAVERGGMERTADGVHYELERLDKAVAALEHLTGMLEERLDPVLRERQDDPTAVPMLARQRCCDVADRIDRSSTNLSSIARRVEGITARLAL